VYANLGRPDEAFAACRRARGLLDASEDPTGLDHRFLVGRLLQRELFLRQLAAPNDGDAEYERAAKHWTALTAEAPRSGDATRELAGVMLLRALNLADRDDRREESDRLAQRVLDILPAGEPGSAALRVRAACVRGRIALADERFDEAHARLREVVANIDALPADPVLAVEKALAMAALGSTLRHLGRAADAERTLQEAIQVTSTNLRLFPGSRSLQRAILLASNELATRRLVEGRIDQAEATLRAAAALATDYEAAPNTQAERSLLAETERQLANCLLMRDDRDGSHSEADQLLRRACDRLVRLVEEQPKLPALRTELAMTWNALASNANEHGRYPEAADFAARAIAQQEVVLTARPENALARTFLGLHQGLLAHALARQGRGAEAVGAAEAAIENAPKKVANLRIAAEAAARAARAATGAEADEYGGVAMRALTAIAALDAEEARRLLADRRFTGLAERDDFLELRRRLMP